MDTDIPSRTHFVYQRLVKIGSCTLNHWAMDFEGNKKRIIEKLMDVSVWICVSDLETHVLIGVLKSILNKYFLL